MAKLRRIMGLGGIIGACVATSVAPLAAQHRHERAPSPYAGEEGRDIAALSPQDVALLEKGEGMGMAKAAELNHFPGPAHAIELADALGLSPRQRAEVQRIFTSMRERAIAKGAEVLAEERRLNDMFRHGTASVEAIEASTRKLGTLYGELRAIHLSAHVETRRLLEPAQAAAYDRLRGYDAAAPRPGGR